MAESLWSQDSFNRGEFSPLMYARITTDAYYNALKTAKNSITLPQGAIEKRFGLKYYAEVGDAETYNNLRIETFEYLNQCTYQLVFSANRIDIYLEGRNLATVFGTKFTTTELKKMSYTIADDAFIMTSENHKPQKLIRSAFSNLIDAQFYVDSSFDATVNESVLETDKVYAAYLTVGRVTGRAQYAFHNPGDPNLSANGFFTLGVPFEFFVTAGSGQTIPSILTAGTSYWGVLSLTNRSWYSLAAYPTETDAINNTNKFDFTSEPNLRFNIDFYTNSQGVVPTPLSLTSTYFVRVTDKTTLTFYNTEADAENQVNAIALTSQGTAPYYIHAYDGANVITAIDTATSTLTFTDALEDDFIYPVKIGKNDKLSSNPVVSFNQVYFLKTTSTTQGKLYSTAEDANNDENQIILSEYVAGPFLLIENSWTIEDIVFRNTPVYDFNSVNYDEVVFTITNTANTTTQTLTAGAAIFSEGYEGGSFSSGGGVARIITFVSPTEMTVELKSVFNDSAANKSIKGKVAELTEPAWSDSRGWPTVCSSFQNRLIFANSESLPNGIWLSAINDYTNFDDIVTDDDDGISWYPSSNDVNYIRFIVPYRSLTIHTNSGIYSTGLGATDAITPRNFSLVLQESTPATVVQPRSIDNQIVVISGNDVHSMLWDAYNNSYQSNIVSVMSEHLIRNPVDEAAYRDLNRAGSRYVFIVNEDGTLAMFQTLISENVAGFTLAELEQSYGTALFKGVCSSNNGRAWFAIDREIAEQEESSFGIESVAATTVTSTGSNYSTTDPVEVLIEAETIPTTTPQIVSDVIYYILGLNADDYKVYPTRADALADTNAISFTNAGTSAAFTSLIEREITAVATTTVTIPSSDYDTSTFTACIFSNNSGTLPTSTPQVTAGTYYWAVGVDANNLKIYPTQDDATNDTNAISFSDIGVNAYLQKWALVEKIYIEELDFSKYIDCADTYEGAATTSVPVDARYNAQEVLMNADGTKYTATVANETFTTTANVTEAQYGFGIHFKVQPLALANAIGSSIRQTNLVFPKHVRTVSMMFNDTLGGTVNNYELPLTGDGTEIFEIATMKAWNDFQNTSITIEHTEPYPIRLLGLFYKIDI